MKQNVKCYICAYCQQCDKEQELKCKEMNYILFTTEEQQKMCKLMCGGIENESEMD